jgi:integrase
LTAITREQPKESTSFLNFVNAIRSSATKTVYINSLKRYMNFIRLTEVDSLIEIRDPRVIESQLIDYIMSLRNDGISYSTIKYLLAPIFTFYQLNDITLNKKKVFRYLGEYKRVVKDKAYTTVQIQQALQNADQRMRMIVLLLSSTGCRIGALPALTVGNLTRIPDHGLYKITFYEGTNNEYYTFCTREAAQTGIDPYLLYRQRCGEKISFNPDLNRWEPEDTPLIRLSFDGTDSFQASRQVRPIALQGLRMALSLHLVRSGLRQVEHPTEHSKRVRKPIKMANGFRKYVISTFIEAGLNHEIRELLVDHATGLDASYFRPSEKQVLEEYLKAEPYLTIDSSARLAQRVETLTIEKSKVEEALTRIDDLYKKLGL